MAFLEYEIVHEDNPGSMVIRITHQEKRVFDDFESKNGYRLEARGYPEWRDKGYHNEPAPVLIGRGTNRAKDNSVIIIPRQHTRKVKQLIKEFNDYHERGVSDSTFGVVLKGVYKDQVDYFVVVNKGKMVNLRLSWFQYGDNLVERVRRGEKLEELNIEQHWDKMDFTVLEGLCVESLIKIMEEV